MGRRLVSWCRRHIIWTNLIVLWFEIIVASLIWLTFGGTQTFGSLNTYVIVCLSIVIASIAALNSMFASVAAHDSLVTTQKSLELTRNSIRPFLYIAGSIGVDKVGKYIKLTFAIQNSGSLPGEDVHVDIDFFDEGEKVTEENTSSKYTVPTRELESPLLFPNSVFYEGYVLDSESKNDLELWDNIVKGKTKCRVRISYKSLEREHITIITEKLAKQEWEDKIVTSPIPPQKWE
jgi:hypothetical protein